MIVISYRNTLSGAVTVIPCSTKEQAGEWTVELKTTIDGRPCWAICDKPTTVAVSRLSLHRDRKHRMPEIEFNQVLARLLEWLPSLPPLDK